MVVGLHVENCMEDLETFSRVMFVDECLLDERRTKAFGAAIKSTIRRGDRVLDAGTGSGILALMAVRAGAAKVYAVEVDPEAALLARKTFAANKEGKRIQLIESDVRGVRLSRPVDVVVMELLDTGLIAEQQAQALNALRRNGVVGRETRFVPLGVSCALELAEYDFGFYGFNMPTVLQARNSGAERHLRRKLSDVVVYREVEFTRSIQTTVRAERNVTVTRGGLLNALRLRTRTRLSDELALWETTDMNMPVIVPVAARRLARGDAVQVRIQYVMGHGYDSLHVSVAGER